MIHILDERIGPMGPISQQIHELILPIVYKWPTYITRIKTEAKNHRARIDGLEQEIRNSIANLSANLLALTHRNNQLRNSL